MLYIKKRFRFLNEAIATTKLSEISDIVTSQLSKNLGEIGVFPPEYIIKKHSGEKLRGKLFVVIEKRYGIRFNWKEEDKYSKIVSVDLWKDVTYLDRLNQPDYTIELNGSVTNALNMIYNYFNKVNEEIDNDPQGHKAEKEEAEIVSIIDLPEDEVLDIKMDLFDLIKYKVYQIANPSSETYSLIITGLSGLGKTYDTEKALQDTRTDYKAITGGVSTSGLYDVLFRYHDKLILFDDCDSVFKSTDSVNMLKGALDSKKIRTLSREIATHFATDGMTMKDILGNHKGDKSIMDNPHLFDEKLEDKMPKNFNFTGRIVFISNLDGDEFDSALITRASAHIDIQMTRNEILDRMRKVMEKMHPEVSYEKKEEVLLLMDHLASTYKTRYPLSIRGLHNAIETRIMNDQLMNFGGKRIPRWQVMIKQDMVEKNAKRRKK